MKHDWTSCSLGKNLVAVALVSLICIMVAGTAIFIRTGGLDMGELSPEMAEKATACHELGMGAGRLMSGGEVTAVKCYER
ncbi:MAG: hypothetical protein ABI165_07560 [Bryobacteraceae bacterium]